MPKARPPLTTTTVSPPVVRPAVAEVRVTVEREDGRGEVAVDIDMEAVRRATMDMDELDGGDGTGGPTEEEGGPVSVLLSRLMEHIDHTRTSEDKSAALNSSNHNGRAGGARSVSFGSGAAAEGRRGVQPSAAQRDAWERTQGTRKALKARPTDLTHTQTGTETQRHPEEQPPATNTTQQHPSLSLCLCVCVISR